MMKIINIRERRCLIDSHAIEVLDQIERNIYDRRPLFPSFLSVSQIPLSTSHFPPEPTTNPLSTFTTLILHQYGFYPCHLPPSWPRQGNASFQSIGIAASILASLAIKHPMLTLVILCLLCVCRISIR